MSWNVDNSFHFCFLYLLNSKTNIFSGKYDIQYVRVEAESGAGIYDSAAFAKSDNLTKMHNILFLCQLIWRKFEILRK
jgi:hypothetical protein